MTFTTLLRSVVDGQLNYYSKQFNIIVEPLEAKAQNPISLKFSGTVRKLASATSYKLVVQRDGEIVEDVDVNLREEYDAQDLENRILLVKQQLHSKYLLLC